MLNIQTHMVSWLKSLISFKWESQQVLEVTWLMFSWNFYWIFVFAGLWWSRTGREAVQDYYNYLWNCRTCVWWLCSAVFSDSLYPGSWICCCSLGRSLGFFVGIVRRGFYCQCCVFFSSQSPPGRCIGGNRSIGRSHEEIRRRKRERRRKNNPCSNLFKNLLNTETKMLFEEFLPAFWIVAQNVFRKYSGRKGRILQPIPDEKNTKHMISRQMFGICEARESCQEHDENLQNRRRSALFFARRRSLNKSVHPNSRDYAKSLSCIALSQLSVCLEKNWSDSWWKNCPFQFENPIFSENSAHFRGYFVINLFNFEGNARKSDCPLGILWSRKVSEENESV